MARTEIVITDQPKRNYSTNPMGTTGDSANNHQITVNNRPVCLVAVNANAATVDYNWELPSGAHTWGTTQEVTVTIPAKAGGVDGVSVVWIDVPGDVLQSGKIYLESADANFADVEFYAVTGLPTR